MKSDSRKNQIIKLLEQDSGDSFLLFALAKEYENEHEFLLAKETYEILHSKNADYLAYYYHYGKLCERLKERDTAMAIYKEGIIKSLESKDLHSKSELQTALMNLEIEEF